ncbi:choice-of-anchor Q domain-containing protein [Wenzhouxiangella sp. EGI_FJ10409]|uniref:choice-of-anchor Q domain-containing protein n=1 Tax=Wenzhouxiangella sp. EGI_FJ10409 TaxID=3243767 RepID=UPI0035E16BD1
MDSSADGALGTSPGACTLRAAIESANTDTAFDACASGSPGLDEIVFDPSLAESTITLAEGQLEITDDLSITGPVTDDAGGIVIDGNAQSRLLFIEGATASEFAVDLMAVTLTNGLESGSEGGAVHVNFADLNLDHVTISDSATEDASSSAGGMIVRNGNLSLTHSAVIRNSTDRHIGGLWVPDGNLDLINSTISDNSAGSSVGGAALGSDVSGNGSLYMIGSTVSGNSDRSDAGGLFISTGTGQTTTILDSNFSDNTTIDGGGGALSILCPDVEITNVVVTGNSSTSGSSTGGGGVWLRSGNMILTDLTIEGNWAARGGGGLWVQGTNLTLNDSRIINNSATGNHGGDESGGGGLLLLFADATINNTTISGNSNESTDHGVRGGGIAAVSADLLLHNSTVSGNSNFSNNEGGGIHLSDGSNAALVHTTIANNTAASGADGIDVAPPSDFVSESQLSLDNSLIVQAEVGETACNAQANSHSNTLATDNSCTGTATGLANIALQPLADNGGPTLTHALGADSVAIDAAGDCGADFSIDLDQRGIPRPGPGSSACDIGAFEFFIDGVFADRFEN